MSVRNFRFGVVAPLYSGMAEWVETAKWAEDVGYDVLLSPDTPNVGSPFIALSAAAAVTTTLRLGTFVLATPTRTPGMIAWETATLDRLSGGRFELGLGAGRPDAEEEAALLGAEWGSAGQRVRQISDTITTVRQRFAEAIQAARASDQVRHGFFRPEQQPSPPIMVAGAGPSLLGVATRQADIVSVGASANAGEDAFADRIAVIREKAVDRIDDIELSVNVWQVGDSVVPPGIARAFGMDLSGAVDNKVVGVLNGSPQEIADVLLRRREEFGLSYLTINTIAMREFVPVIELLRGK